MSDWSTTSRTKGPLAPNRALWAALGEGVRLRAMLEDFYARVFADARLRPFFEGVTQERVVDKQYSFLREVFTGERCYFGDRPRNAHHWMVISDELFDYREELMTRVMREHGLAEEHVQAWRAVHEVFRKQIVKSAPVPRRMAGIEMPDGWATDTLACGAICDGCQGVLSEGTRVTWHRRKGTTYCDPCAKERSVA